MKYIHVVKIIILANSLLVSTLWAIDSSQIPSSHYRTPRIIGGQLTQEGQWPWMVSLEYKDSPGTLCGGSLIHPYWVLTAAHCVDGFDPLDPPLTGQDLFVVVGLHKQSQIETTGERLEVSQIIQHPQWNPLNPNSPFDIALLQLATPSTHTPIMLATSVSDIMKPSAVATVLGWGFTSADDDNSGADTLQKVELPIISNATCQTAYETERKIFDSMLCAGVIDGKKDSCIGDSGGPLMVFEKNQWRQVGIVSIGGKRTGPRCGGSDAYGIYTRVSTYVNFISQYVPVPLAGSYDGVWTSPSLPNTFVVLRNTNDSITVIFLNNQGQNWQALLGLINQTHITVTHFISNANIVAELKPRVTPSPPTTQMDLTMIACQPEQDSANDQCLFPEGTTIHLEKIF